MKSVKSILVLLVILAALLPIANAQVAVKSFELNPQTVSPGDELSLYISVENVGDDDLENVMVSLDLTQVPFAPVESSNEKVIDKINDHDSERANFRLRALPDAEPALYKIPVVLSHDDVSKTSVIGVEVKAAPSLDLILDESELVKVNDQGKVTIKFVNNGLTQVKFLKATLAPSPLYKIISPDTMYIGDVDVGDFQTEDFTIIANIDDPILTFNLEYRDANNNEFTSSQLVPLKVYTEEEAKQLGLVQNKSSSSLLIIALIAIIAGFFIYRRIRRKRRQHEI